MGLFLCFSANPSSAADVASLLTEADVTANDLAFRLTKGLYGKAWHGFTKTARTKDEWLEYLAKHERGEIPAGLMARG